MILVSFLHYYCFVLLTVVYRLCMVNKDSHQRIFQFPRLRFLLFSLLSGQRKIGKKSIRRKIPHLLVLVRDDLAI